MSYQLFSGEGCCYDQLYRQLKIKARINIVPFLRLLAQHEAFAQSFE